MLNDLITQTQRRGRHETSKGDGYIHSIVYSDNFMGIYLFVLNMYRFILMLVLPQKTA